MQLKPPRAGRAAPTPLIVVGSAIDSATWLRGCGAGGRAAAEAPSSISSSTAVPNSSRLKWRQQSAVLLFVHTPVSCSPPQSCHHMILGIRLFEDFVFSAYVQADRRASTLKATPQARTVLEPQCRERARLFRALSGSSASRHCCLLASPFLAPCSRATGRRRRRPPSCRTLRGTSGWRSRPRPTRARAAAAAAAAAAAWSSARAAWTRRWAWRRALRRRWSTSLPRSATAPTAWATGSRSTTARTRSPRRSRAHPARRR